MQKFGYLICHLLEILRYIAVFSGIYLANSVHDQNLSIIFISSFFVIGLAGLTGLEGLFLGKFSSSIVGYKIENSRYQKQSAFNNLALAFATIIGLIMHLGIMYHIALLITLLLFLCMSAINHFLDTIYNKNYSIRNILRPIITLILVIISIQYIHLALN